MEKSYVGLDTKVCPVCGQKHDVGVLLDKRLKNTLDRQNLTGYEECKDCKDKLVDYTALVVVKNTETGKTLKQENADRTGELIWMKKEAFKRMFNAQHNSPMVFIDEQVAEHLHKLAEDAEKREE